MTFSKYALPFALACCALLLILAGCQQSNDNANTTATSSVTPPGVQTLTLVPRPAKIVDMMKARGEQDEAKPTLKIISPAKDGVISGSKVDVKLQLAAHINDLLPQ